MKRWVEWLLVMSFVLVGAKKNPANLVRLTVVNKSEFPIAVKLTGENEANFYYLQVPKGSRELPTEKTFTIARDYYRMQIYYIELWDPVYGTKCGSGGGGSLQAFRNLQITVNDCDYRPSRSSPSSIPLPAPKFEYRY